MDKRFLIIMAIVIAAFIGLFVFSGSNSDTAQGGQPSNHIKGNPDGLARLVVYEDFGCPACAAFAPIVDEVVKIYSDKISYQFKHYPIPSSTNSFAAHRAAEAAGMQGKFFDMYELLFPRQQQWSQTDSARSLFETYAQEIGLDVGKFNEDFEAESTNSTINADKQEGIDAGVTGTPTFFLNGQPLDNNDIQTVESFSKLVEEAIAASENQ